MLLLLLQLLFNTLFLFKEFLLFIDLFFWGDNVNGFDVAVIVGIEVETGTLPREPPCVLAADEGL